jgi:Domain of unknown function (4846)
MKKIPFLLSFFIALECGLADNNARFGSPALDRAGSYRNIGEIKLPDGCKRVQVEPGSFGQWLRKIPLRKDNHVYLYDGSLKRNQLVQFAVLDIPVGKKDLQQCADAVMRLRAEYLFSVKKFDEIKFTDNAGKAYEWKGNNNRVSFDSYLENVFGACGSASLEKQLNPVAGIHEIKPGDVFIKGGFPGHAMVVVDMATDDKGKKYFMLAQSYMPAQDIHIVRNPMNEELSPWYEVSDAAKIVTPEWVFYKNQLRQW